jgi:uncharacterized membrane protein YgcG
LGLEPASTLLLACCCCIDIKQTPRRSEVPPIRPQNPKHPQIQNFNPSALVPLAAGWHDAHRKRCRCVGLWLGTIALLETDQVTAELILEQGAVEAKRLDSERGQGQGGGRGNGLPLGGGGASSMIHGAGKSGKHWFKPHNSCNCKK